MIGTSETQTTPVEQVSEEVIHLIELCPRCWRTRAKWCGPGVTLMVRCGKMHTAKAGVFEDGATDCIKCVMALPSGFCAHCGVPVEQRD